MNEQTGKWSKATLYPDMRVDPEDHPRNSDGVSPDGEVATLQEYPADYRPTLLIKCEGLTPEQLARRSVPPSTMSLLGLLRHLAEVERDRRGWITPGDRTPSQYGGDGGDLDGARAEQGVVDAAYEDLERECTDGRVGQ